MASPVRWQFKADYVETCNCDFGCPCNFNGFPTHGGCDSLVGFKIQTGSYAGVALDGVKFVMAASWPRAIHQGEGTACVYIDQQASPEQRAAIAEIAYGRAGGSGPFPVFAGTFRSAFGPEYVPIEMHIDGRRSRFSIPGILDADLAPHIDPVSGGEQDVRIQLPSGFIWKTAYAAKSAVMKILSPNFKFDHSGRNAFYATVEYEGGD